MFLMWDDTFYIELQISSLFMLYLLHIFGLDLSNACVFQVCLCKEEEKPPQKHWVFLCMEKHYQSKNYPKKLKKINK